MIFCFICDKIYVYEKKCHQASFMHHLEQTKTNKRYMLIDLGKDTTLATAQIEVADIKMHRNAIFDFETYTKRELMHALAEELFKNSLVEIQDIDMPNGNKVFKARLYIVKPEAIKTNKDKHEDSSME